MTSGNSPACGGRQQESNNHDVSDRESAKPSVDPRRKNGPIGCSAAQVNDRVLGVIAIGNGAGGTGGGGTGGGANVGSSFESSISVVGQIQQTAAGDMSGSEFWVVLAPVT